MKKILFLLALPLLLVSCGSQSNTNECSNKNEIQEDAAVSGKTYYFCSSVVDNTLNKNNSNHLVFSDSTFEFIGGYQDMDFLENRTYPYKLIGNDLFMPFNDGTADYISYLGEFSFKGELFKTYSGYLFATEAYFTEQLGITVIWLKSSIKGGFFGIITIVIWLIFKNT